jgi:hypothetical protein
VVIYEVGEDGSIAEVATVYGPVVADAKSEWFVVAKQGTN